MVCYGKTLGGGLPVGVLCGKKVRRPAAAFRASPATTSTATVSLAAAPASRAAPTSTATISSAAAFSFTVDFPLPTYSPSSYVTHRT